MNRIVSRMILSGMLVLAAIGLWRANAEPAKPKVDSLRVYALDCGHISFADFGIFSDTGEYDGKSRELADTCVLVGHPKGWLLWDTGLPKIFKEKPTKAFGPTVSVSKTIQEQLSEIGLVPDDINYVTFSHFHFDHTGNANDFPKATWILQKKELAYALSEPTPYGIDPQVFSSYQSAQKTMIDGDYDVFGDGSVRFLKMPGHTPGHQALLVKLSQQNYLFSGDLYHREESRQHGYVPSFNYNRADTLASIDRLEKLLKIHHAKLVVQHDEGDFESLPEIPRYLK